MSDLVLKNCKFAEKEGEYYISIYNGKIKEISKQPIESDKKIDIGGKFVLPGLIDPHVHFRDPGLTYKEDFKSGSMAAAHGGFTCILDMPNTIPPTNTAKYFQEKKKIAESKSIIDFGLHAGVDCQKELKKIAKLNPVSFKLFMDLKENEEIETIFKKVSETNRILTVHAEDKSTIENETKKLISEGRNSAIDYSYARPSIAEDISVNLAIKLSKKYGINLHICHISSKKALKEIIISKINEKNNNNNNNNNDKDKDNGNSTKNYSISCEITPHHLFLDSSGYEIYDTIVKTNPPLRSIEKKITIDDFTKNIINMIGTDHAPHSLEEKEKGVWKSSPGIPNLETVLPLMLTEVNKKRVDLKMISKMMSQNPAERFNLSNKGKITVGNDADLVIIDLKKEGKFEIDDFYTKAKYSPFENWNYKGRAIMTINNGKIIMDDGTVFTDNKGRYVCD